MLLIMFLDYIGVQFALAIYQKHAVEKTSKGEASAQDYEALPAAQTTAPVPAFQPIYKVSCKANNVKYSLRIDAVNGNILQSKAGK